MKTRYKILSFHNSAFEQILFYEYLYIPIFS